MTQRIINFLRSMQKYIDRAWYIPAVALLAFADIFILVVPTDALLISAVLLRPKRWLYAALLVGLGSAVGATLVGALASYDVGSVTQWLAGTIGGDKWQWMDAFLDQHGFLALVVLAVGPIPFQPAIALVALAGMPIPEIFLATLVGRTGKYLLLAWLASHAPKYLTKFHGVQKEMVQLTGHEITPPVTDATGRVTPNES